MSQAEKDVVAEVLDNCRCWQVRNILTIYLLKIVTAFFMACIIYTAPVPTRAPIYCKPETSNDSWIQIFHPQVVDWNDKQFDLPLCDAYRDAARRVPGSYPPFLPPEEATPVVSCEAFQEATTLFDLMCSRGALIVLTQGIHLIGILLSGPVARLAMRTISPKRVLQGAVLTQIVFGNLAGIPGSLAIHLVLRCIAAIGCAAAFGAGSAINITTGRLQTGALVLFDVFWSIGIVILSVVTQFESRFMELYFIISNPSIIILIFSIGLTDAPRWLLKRGIVGEVERILERASKVTLPEGLYQNLKILSEELSKKPPPESFREVLRTSKHLFRIVCFHMAWACFTIMYFGMVLNMRNYGRHSLPTSALWLAGSETLGCLLAFLLCLSLPKWKWHIAGSFNVIGALVASCMWLFPDEEEIFVEKGVLLYFALVLKMSVSTSFGILTVSTKDVVARNQTEVIAFSGILFGRTCLLLAPVFVALASVFGEYVTLSIFASLGCLGGLAMISVGVSHNQTNQRQEK